MVFMVRLIISLYLLLMVGSIYIISVTKYSFKYDLVKLLFLFVNKFLFLLHRLVR
jgi:hypothetical protein